MLRDRVLTINDSALSRDFISNPAAMGIFLGRKLEIQDLLNMNFKELMGEE